MKEFEFSGLTKDIDLESVVEDEEDEASFSEWLENFLTVISNDPQSNLDFMEEEILQHHHKVEPTESEIEIELEKTLDSDESMNGNYFLNHCLLIDDEIFHAFDSETLDYSMQEILVSYSQHRVKGHVATDNFITTSEKSLRLSKFRFLAVDIDDAPRLAD